MAIRYYQQVTRCGKPRCRKCREGTGHGPYWYAYTTVDGRTTRSYVGKNLPPEALESAEEAPREYIFPTRVRVFILGQMRLERYHDQASAWETITESLWKQGRARSLLGFLVSVPGRQLNREQVMDALWPDEPAEVATNRLDRAVY